MSCLFVYMYYGGHTFLCEVYIQHKTVNSLTSLLTPVPWIYLHVLNINRTLQHRVYSLSFNSYVLGL